MNSVYEQNEFKASLSGICTNSEKCRRVLLLGNYNFSNSILSNVLQDPCYVFPSASAFSEHYRPYSLSTFSLNDVNFNVVQAFHEMKRPDDLDKTIEFCTLLEVESLDAVVCCVSLDAGISNSDLAYFNEAISRFSKLQIPIILCITQLDQSTMRKQFQTSLLEQLKQHLTFRSENVQVVFLSCITDDVIHETSDNERLKNIFIRAYQTRKDLIERLLNTNNSIEYSIMTPRKKKSVTVRVDKNQYLEIPRIGSRKYNAKRHN